MSLRVRVEDLVSSRLHARRGSVGFNSKAVKGGWVTWGLAPPSTAGQVLVPTGGRVGGLELLGGLEALPAFPRR